MKDLYLEKELDKVKKDPEYIAYFTKMIMQQLGNQGEQIESILEEACSFYKNKKHLEGYIQLGLLKVKYYIRQGRFQKAIERALEACEMIKEIEEGITHIKWYNVLLISYIHTGQLEDAVEYAIKGLEWMKSEPCDEVHLSFLLCTALLYTRLEEYIKARQMLRRVQEMEPLFTNELKMFSSRILFELSLRENRLEEAQQERKKMYEILSQFRVENDYRFHLNEILILRGELYAKRGLNVQAEKDFMQAYEEAVAYEWLENRASVLIAWSEYAYYQKDWEMMQAKVNEGIEIAHQMHSEYHRYRIQSIQGRFLEAQNRWEEAYKCLKGQHAYGEQLRRIQSSMALSQLDDEVMARQVAHYKMLYEQMQQVAQIGTCFTSYLQEDRIPESMYSEVAKLLDLDVVGIGITDQNHLDYELYSLHSQWIEETNDLVRYTERLIEHCIAFQEEMVIQDGNFERYSLKHIQHSETKMQLESAIILPLKVQNQVIGAILIGSYTSGVYSSNDINSARIVATYLAIALKKMKLYRQVVYLAEHDGLTGLLTRGSVLNKEEVSFREYKKNHKQIAVLMFDTDYFKTINDKYGHYMGDKVLQKLGQIIKEAITPQDYAGRYGGEEFIIFLNDTSMAQAIEVAEHIREALGNTIFEIKKDKSIQVTLSGGIYLCNEYTLNLEDAIRFADHALYRAKILGRNRIIHYDLQRMRTLRE